MNLGIFGAGSLGKEILDIVYPKIEQWDEVFFIDDVIAERKINGINVYRYSEIIKYSGEQLEVVIASGEPYYREKMLSKINKDGYHCATVVSNSAYISNSCKLARGCIIFPNTYIGVNVSLEENTIIHAGARIESNCNIGKNSFISLGAFIGADTFIGKGAFIGPNSSVKDHLYIGEYAVVGMGAVVNKTVENEDVVVGNPARYLRKNISKKIFDYSIIE